MCSQPDALAFAAAQRFGRAVQSEIGEAHINHELQAFPNFFQHIFGNGILLVAQLCFNAIKPQGQFIQINIAEFGNVFARYFKPQAFFFQPGTVASRAGVELHVAFGPITNAIAATAVEPTLNHRHHAFKHGVVIAAAVLG